MHLGLTVAPSAQSVSGIGSAETTMKAGKGSHAPYTEMGQL